MTCLFVAAIACSCALRLNVEFIRSSMSHPQCVRLPLYRSGLCMATGCQLGKRREEGERGEGVPRGGRERGEREGVLRFFIARTF